MKKDNRRNFLTTRIHSEAFLFNCTTFFISLLISITVTWVAISFQSDGLVSEPCQQLRFLCLSIMPYFSFNKVSECCIEGSGKRIQPYEISIPVCITSDKL